MALGDRIRNMIQHSTGAGSTPTDFAVLKHNQEMRRKEQAKTYIQRYDGKQEAVNALNLFRETGEIPEYFQNDTAAWQEYLADFDKRQRISPGTKSVTPEDVYKLRGDAEMTKYFNETGFAQTYLGPDKVLGEDTSYGMVTRPDGTETLGIKPVVRTADKKGGRIYSADMTYGGKRVRDLYAEGGDEAVEAGTIQGLPFQGLINEMDEDYGQDVAKRGDVDSYLRFLTPAQAKIAFDPNAPRAEKDKVAQEKMAEYEAAKGRVSKLTQQLKEWQETPGSANGTQGGVTTVTEQDPATVSKAGKGAFGYQVQTGPAAPGGMQPLQPTDGTQLPVQQTVTLFPNGAEVNQKLNELDSLLFGTFKPVKSGNLAQKATEEASGTESDPKGFTYNRDEQEQTIKEAGLDEHFGGTGNAFNANDPQWNQMGDEGRRNAIRIENRITMVNQQRVAKKANASLRETYKTHRDAPTGTNIADLANDKTVKEFYRKNLPQYGQNLGQLLLAKPELMEEYRADPYQFALNHPDISELYGTPASAEETEITTAGSKGVNLSAAEKAIATGDRAALERELKGAQGLAAEAQQALVDHNKERKGDYYAWTKRQRAAMVVSMLASLPETAQIRKALIAKGPLDTFLETGQWSLVAEDLANKQANTQRQLATHNFNVTKWVSEQAELHGSGTTSEESRQFFENVIQLGREEDDGEYEGWRFDKTKLAEVGALITTEGNRLAAQRRDMAKAGVAPAANAAFRQDYQQYITMQMNVIKSHVLEISKPNWIDELMTATMIADPEQNAFEMVPGATPYDHQHNEILDPYADPTTIKYWTMENGVTFSAGKLDGPLGRPATTVLLYQSVLARQKLKESR